VLATAVFGFLGGKLYYLAEHTDQLSCTTSAVSASPGSAASSPAWWRASLSPDATICR